MNAEIILLPLICFSLAAAVLFVVGRLGWRRLGLGLCTLTALAFLAASLASQTWTGWDALGWFIVAALMTLPALIGAGAGLALGLWWRRRKA